MISYILYIKSTLIPGTCLLITIIPCALTFVKQWYHVVYPHSLIITYIYLLLKKEEVNLMVLGFGLKITYNQANKALTWLTPQAGLNHFVNCYSFTNLVPKILGINISKSASDIKI